jgi:two-component sensor histidine kinase
MLLIENITDSKTADKRHKLLLDELSHRVKNTLATVQSISLQTMRSVENDPYEFRRRFQSRLISLSKAHDLLTTYEWAGAGLRELINLTLAPYTGDISIAGPPVYLSSNAAMTLNMVFHELATNAAKYGGLSVPDGRLSISWEYDDPRRPTCIKVIWKERGGPCVSLPLRRGFGTRMIETGPRTELWAKTELMFEPDGVVCILDIPFTAKVMRYPPSRLSSRG